MTAKQGAAVSVFPRPSWYIASIAAVSTTCCILLIYHKVVGFTVKTWLGNETYMHGFLIPLICAWLIWRKRDSLAKIPPGPDYRGIFPIIITGILWELGYQAGAMVVQQYSLVAMIVASIWTLLGSAVFRIIRFPLLFLFFAVPFGEALIPSMMNFTADFTVSALQMTGIPVFREGNFLSLPSGNWSVVEACSGLRYFVSSLTLGVLYAHLTYQSWNRKLIFVAAAATVPILANGFRAYMIVMIGHLSNMHLAVGIDHLIYGWIFFGIVMLLLFWVGSFFHEEGMAPAMELPPPATRSASAISILPVFAAIAAFVLLPKLYAAHLDEKLGAPVTISLAPPAVTGSWQKDSRPLSDWTPHYLGSKASFKQSYDNGDTRVSLFVAYYRNQHQGAELVSSKNKLVTTLNGEWSKIGESSLNLDVDGERIPLAEVRLRSPEIRLLAWKWYWVASKWVINPYLAKILEAKSRILDGKDDAAVIVLYAPYATNAASAAGDMREFLHAMLSGLKTTLNHANPSNHVN